MIWFEVLSVFQETLLCKNNKIAPCAGWCKNVQPAESVCKSSLAPNWWYCWEARLTCSGEGQFCRIVLYIWDEGGGGLKEDDVKVEKARSGGAKETVSLREVTPLRFWKEEAPGDAPAGERGRTGAWTGLVADLSARSYGPGRDYLVTWQEEMMSRWPCEVTSCHWTCQLIVEPD